MMTTSDSILRVPASFFVARLVSLLGLLGPLGGCIIDAKIGNDPLGGESTQGDTEGYEESSTSAFPGYTSGEPGTATATSAGPGSDGGGPITATATSATSTATSSGDTEGPVDVDAALEICGVEVVPPEPGGPLYQEGIECSGGCQVDIESGVFVNLYELYGECLCEVLGCGPASGSSTTGEAPTDDGGSSSSGGEPDGCGMFPPGDGSFTCACEMCSIDVTEVDAAWAEGADLQTICECMCGGAGCGSPV